MGQVLNFPKPNKKRRTINLIEDFDLQEFDVTVPAGSCAVCGCEIDPVDSVCPDCEDIAYGPVI